METIKFRIYNPEEKKMIESGATPMMLHSFFQNTARLNTQLEMPYLQFTGLFDKAKKEIYEGDIVRKRWKNRFDGEEDLWFTSEILQMIPQNFHWLSELEDMEVELIGNIYENPELLTK